MPIRLDYHDSDAGLDIGALLARGRKARRRHRAVLGGLSAVTVLALVGAGAGIATARQGGSPRHGLATGATAYSPWIETNGNASNSRANISETTLTAASVARIRHLRTYTAPAASVGCSTSVSAALSGGDVTALVNGYLVHYDAQTGHVIWRTPFVDGGGSAIAISDGEVIVGAAQCGSASDAEGFVDAFSLTTGKAVWHVDSIPVCTPAGNGENCYSAGGMSGLVVGNGYIVTGGSTPASGNGVAVLNVTNGSLVWEDTTSTCAVGVPIVVDQQVIFTKCNPSGAPRMVADALATGARTWQQSGAWTVQRGDFAQTRGDHVLALDPAGVVVDVIPRTGRTQGQLITAGAILAVDASRAYATCGPADPNGGRDSVCGYLLSSHRLVWRSTAHPGTTLGVEAGGVVYLNSGAMLNATNGKRLGAAFRPGTDAVLGMSVGEGRLAVVAGNTSELYGLAGE
jgi:hypothetical protein